MDGWGKIRALQRHLYLQIFAGFLLILLALALLIGGLFWHLGESHLHAADAEVAMLLDKLLPTTNSPAETAEVLGALSAVTGGTVALHAPAGQLLQSAGPAGAQPDPATRPNAAAPPAHDIRLLDGRRLLLEERSGNTAKHLAWIAVFLLLAAIGAYPVSRRLTRRIEALQAQAQAWGHGQLSVRATDQGCDEIAELARCFNQAAERVESLLDSQRAMLAAASHELRSPLARIRMACGLIGDERADLQAQIARDIAELDTLIGDLLLASRLSSATPQLQLEPVDLLGLAAEESARVGAKLAGIPFTLHADRRLLRHLLRNLLENGRRHGDGSSIEVEIEAQEDGGALLRVLDRGPGIAEAEREKVFEPFYRPPGTAETGDGVGYGLALVRRIVRLHGGDARCLPRDGGGACFEVRLPRSVAPG